jgi:hypothetical protein
MMQLRLFCALLLKNISVIQGVFEFEAFPVTRGTIILNNFGLNLLSKMFILEIIDCIFLLFSKILSPVLSISPLY